MDLGSSSPLITYTTAWLAKIPKAAHWVGYDVCGQVPQFHVYLMFKSTFSIV